jgi:hypothetical protein
VVGIGVVVDRPAENIDSNGTFFEVFRVPFESPFHNVPQKVAVPLTAPEYGARENSFQLIANVLIGQVGRQGRPRHLPLDTRQARVCQSWTRHEARLPGYCGL